MNDLSLMKVFLIRTQGKEKWSSYDRKWFSWPDKQEILILEVGKTQPPHIRTLSLSRN
jgi:hypothetical protein